MIRNGLDARQLRMLKAEVRSRVLRRDMAPSCSGWQPDALEGGRCAIRN